MGKFATRLLTLAMYTTALAMAPMATPVEAATGSDKPMKHRKKIQRSPGVGDSWSAGQARPVTRPYYGTGEVCPGMGRSFDCKIWPPPYDEDPDRKVPGRH
jgi:hypothetical protein